MRVSTMRHSKAMSTRRGMRCASFPGDYSAVTCRDGHDLIITQEIPSAGRDTAWREYPAIVTECWCGHDACPPTLLTRRGILATVAGDGR